MLTLLTRSQRITCDIITAGSFIVQLIKTLYTKAKCLTLVYENIFKKITEQSKGENTPLLFNLTASLEHLNQQRTVQKLNSL